MLNCVFACISLWSLFSPKIKLQLDLYLKIVMYVLLFWPPSPQSYLCSSLAETTASLWLLYLTFINVRLSSASSSVFFLFSELWPSPDSLCLIPDELDLWNVSLRSINLFLVSLPSTVCLLTAPLQWRGACVILLVAPGRRQCLSHICLSWMRFLVFINVFTLNILFSCSVVFQV